MKKTYIFKIKPSYIWEPSCPLIRHFGLFSGSPLPLTFQTLFKLCENVITLISCWHKHLDIFVDFWSPITLWRWRYSWKSDAIPWDWWGCLMNQSSRSLNIFLLAPFWFTSLLGCDEISESFLFLHGDFRGQNLSF